MTGTPTLEDLTGDSVEFNLYDVDANGATTLIPGDNISLVDSEGNSLSGEGTYLGSGTIEFAPLVFGGPLANVTVQVPPLTGSLIESNGSYYLITEDPMDLDSLEAELSLFLALPGPDLEISATAPINDLADAFAAEIAELPGPYADFLASKIDDLDKLVAFVAAQSPIGIVHDNTVPLILTDVEVLCFMLGTIIETQHGPVAVEDLKVGDMVLTRDDGYQPIRWIGSVRLSAARLARQPKLRPVRIKAGALGSGLPSADLYVSPQHRILVRSKIAVKMFGAMEVLVPAKQLLQLDGIDYADDRPDVVYFHFLFDRHQIVLSNGAETESLFTGPQALRSLSSAALQEVYTLFPELQDESFEPESARPLVSGRRSRKLALRHADKGKALVC
ncbi:Hint domain-containing protein [Paracoccus ravus]|uniref:Hint domain-containing protein n=1 Tax=Paracoccus ravus TaxID=2447760 RepID=UPI001FD6E59B|nr:Hint domain-containing protein [Paracoccus ravus]